MSNHISKYSNLYNKDGQLLKSVSEDGVLHRFSIKETEDLVDSLEKGSNEYRNAVNMLTDMYQNPRTEEDKEYVRKMQQELLERLQKQAKQRQDEENSKARALGEVEHELEKNYGPEDAEIVEEPVSDMAA